jgi:hypothetical protein
MPPAPSGLSGSENLTSAFAVGHSSGAGRKLREKNFQRWRQKPASKYAGVITFSGTGPELLGWAALANRKLSVVGLCETDSSSFSEDGAKPLLLEKNEGELRIWPSLRLKRSC